MVMLLMQHGADPNKKDGEGCSGLHLAAQFGHTAIVAYLVAKSCHINDTDSNGMTALMWSCFRANGLDPTRMLLTLGNTLIGSLFSDTNLSSKYVYFSFCRSLNFNER